MRDIAFLAFVRGLLWIPCFYFAIRHQSKATLAVIFLSWTANVLLVQGLLIEQGMVGVAFVALTSFLLIERLDKNPEHVKRVMAVQLKEARQFAHDQIGEAASEFARQMTMEMTRRRRAEELLDEHGIEH